MLVPSNQPAVQFAIVKGGKVQPSLGAFAAQSYGGNSIYCEWFVLNRLGPPFLKETTIKVEVSCGGCCLPHQLDVGTATLLEFRIPFWWLWFLAALVPPAVLEPCLVAQEYNGKPCLITKSGYIVKAPAMANLGVSIIGGTPLP